MRVKSREEGFMLALLQTKHSSSLCLHDTLSEPLLAFTAPLLVVFFMLLNMLSKLGNRRRSSKEKRGHGAECRLG